MNRTVLLEAGEALGLSQSIGQRELNRMMSQLPRALEHLFEEITDENTRLPDPVKPFLAGEIRLLNTLRHIVIPETLARLT